MDLSDFKPQSTTLNEAFLNYQRETEHRKTLTTVIWNTALAVFFVVWGVSWVVLRVKDVL